MPSETRRSDARISRDSDVGKTQSKEKTREKSVSGPMDRWVEPTVATKPSFEDHGGAPYGVLEGMQPLGEPPSAKARARAKGEGARKSMLGRSAAGVGVDAQETPEGTPGPQASLPIEPELPPPPPIVIDDEDDDDYAPGAKKSKKKERASKSRAPKRSSEPVESAAGPSTAQPKKKKEKVNTNKVYNAAKLKKVVEEAKRRAYESDKPDLADAVHEIWLESLKNKRLTELLEAVLLQNATEEQTKEFHVYVKQAKKRLRQAKEAGRDLPSAQANGSSSNATKSLPVRSPTKSSPQASAVTSESRTALPSTERAELPKPKISLKVKSPHKPGEQGRPKSGHRHSASPAKPKTEDLDDLSDLSELTELSEDDEKMHLDTPEIGSDAAGPANGVNGITAKDHAAERGSLSVQSRNLKRSSADADLEETEEDKELAAKKQRLSASVAREYDYTESSMRNSLDGQTRPARGAAARNSGVVPPKITLHANGAGNGSARTSRAISADAESPLSSPALSSRRSTPHVWRGPPKATGKRAKTKTSPTKKEQSEGGVMGADRYSPIGADDNEELSENHDFCSACGGSGYLLCCDGCDRSFHFSCLDPPLNENASELNEPWYCYICVAKRPVTATQPEKASHGIFASLLNDLNKKNPQNYSLPRDIRDYYENVNTGKHGEFVEVAGGGKPKSFYEQKPDDFRVKDSKGWVLCYYCGQSSMGRRAIITCDTQTCGNHWHLDCLDPPLTNPPKRDANGGKVGTWECPLHVSHALRTIETSRLYRPPPRTVKMRKPKSAKTVEPAMSRGARNNGIIEVLDDSSDTDSEFYDDDLNGSVSQKLPSKGIQLDFITSTKQKRQREREDEAMESNKRFKPNSALPQARLDKRPMREQQAALSLARFSVSEQNKDLDLNFDRTSTLVAALIAEADPDVTDSMTAEERAIAPLPARPEPEETGPLTDDEKRTLERLQELIQRRLEQG